MCEKMLQYSDVFSKVLTCPSGQVFCKSTYMEAIFTDEWTDIHCGKLAA